MATTNPITGKVIKTGFQNLVYADGWERIWGNKEELKEDSPIVDSTTVEEPDKTAK